ncbi:MAG: T9SS type A sorting domain-containing protein [Saprospiraceae bacterium]
MKDLYLLFGFLLLNITKLIAQISPPEFETPFYIVDSRGNRDTVVLGYDPRYDADVLKTWWGEASLKMPFDSVLEARVYRGFTNFNDYFGKKSITKNDVDPDLTCTGTVGDVIIIQAKYPPISIHFDSSLFQNGSCREFSFMSPDFSGMVFSMDPWSSKELLNLTDSGTYTTDFSSFYNDKFAWWHADYFVQGKEDKVVIPGIAVKFYGPRKRIIADRDIYSNNIPLSIYPNPASAEILVGNDNLLAEQIQIFDITGKLVLQLEKKIVFEKYRIDVSNFADGLYFVQVRDSEGQQRTGKFLKVE